MTPYTYLIKNKITNQYYYGSRCRNVFHRRSPEDDLWKYYFSSSKVVKSLIDVYGKDSFEHTIIFTDIDYEKCFWVEQDKIKESVGDALCLNMRYVDKLCGLKIFSASGKTPHNKNKKTPEITRHKQSNSAKLRAPMTDITKKRMSLSRSGDNKPKGMLGKKHTVETTRKQSASMIGKNKGRILGKQPADVIEKRVAHRRGTYQPIVVCPHCSKSGGRPQMIQWHFDKCKLK